MPEHVPMEWGQGGSDRMHHSSRSAEVAVGPLADVFDQRSTFIVRRPKKTLGTYLANFVHTGFGSNLSRFLLRSLVLTFCPTFQLPHCICCGL